MDRAPVYAYVIQVIVAANHMSGKDTHVRGLRVLGPLEYANFIYLLDSQTEPIL
jgi:Anaphase-promoting complex, subunit 10 (APC10)